MAINYTNIDELLDETADMAEEASCIQLKQIEIDHLLERTSDWQ
ncbi:hypothetical protein SAMN05192533_110139 [Mesobacillus persicus]|uniref:Uncharacterized protein n=1 Tax=Mesobacillus persicus TaxID=930146 RepID=A0A1H8EWU5_9BACI|nr:hypothetical protein [Mesobacillus persicus]SEN24101.1 hypothetical protein SAMN05192533_110139 [Mesobacillus persicus]